MLVSPGLRVNCSGLIRLAPPKISSHLVQRRHSFGLQAPRRFFDRSINGKISSKHVGGFCSVSAGFARESLSFHDELPNKPLWLNLLKDIIWSVRSLFSFMAEQPSQLKYIEWPSFTTTLRTATLSLFLVSCFHCGAIICGLCSLLHIDFDLEESRMNL